MEQENTQAPEKKVHRKTAQKQAREASTTPDFSQEREKKWSNEALDQMRSIGILVKSCVFHSDVDNNTTAGGTEPVSGFSIDAPKKSRNAKMWYTPHGLLYLHNGTYGIVPLSNVKFAKLV